MDYLCGPTPMVTSEGCVHDQLTLSVSLYHRVIAGLLEFLIGNTFPFGEYTQRVIAEDSADIASLISPRDSLSRILYLRSEFLT